MAHTVRHKQWIGGLGSLFLQTLLFIPLDRFGGHWVSALTIIFINIGLASTYRSANPYLQGARWATFASLTFVSIARHTYWYEPMLETFIRLSTFDRPLEWDTLLCRGTFEASLITGSTSLLLLAFYFLTTRWPDWTGRWEMLRRAPFSASLGFQAIIATAVIYPTPLTLTTALFFAGVVSPIVRRQVRLNHVVFLMLTPLFSLGVPVLAAFWGIVCGLVFFYFVAAERTLTTLSASLSFFNGVAFSALALSTTQSWVRDTGIRELVGIYSLFCFTVFAGLAYLLLIRGQRVVEFLRLHLMGLVPDRVKHHPWWSIRDLWVDREVAHRVGKLFKWKEQPKTIGYFIFGPKAWAPRSEVYDRVPYPQPVLAAPILALPLYAFFQGVDSALFLTTGQLWVTIGGLLLSFLIVLGAPIVLLGMRTYTLASKLLAGMSLIVLGTYMVSIVYFGFTSTEGLTAAADNFASSTGQEAVAADQPLMYETDCTCEEQEEPLGMPGLEGH